MKSSNPQLMLQCYCKSLFYLTGIVRTSPAVVPRVHVQVLHKYSTFTVTETSKELSFTENYLINNCGFSPESALSASKLVHFQTSEKPNSVLAFFSNFGFSDSQLHHIIRRAPKLLVSNPSKTLFPKLQFLQSKGASNSQLAHIVTRNPRFLQRSLENHLIPTFNLLKGFLQSDERTILAIKRDAYLISYHPLRHNITFLLDHGVRESSIATLLRQWPSLITYRLEELRKMADEIREMGLDPSKATFIPALYAMSLRKSTWESKVDLYKRWKWTDEAIHQAFARHPFCMLISERKIEEGMEFFVNHLGWNPLVLANYPVLLSLSLKKRIIPRASVLQFLQSRDLIKDARNLYAFFISEKMFLQKYVTCFEDQAPQLLDLYKDKMNLSG